jgi:uncharacterized membrane protein YccC
MKNNLKNRQKTWFVVAAIAFALFGSLLVLSRIAVGHVPEMAVDFALGSLIGVAIGAMAMVIVVRRRSSVCS